MKHVLLILPDADLRARLGALLEEAGYKCRGDSLPEEFVASFNVVKPDLAVLGQQLPAYETEAWSRVIAGLSPSTRLMNISSSADGDRRKVVSAHGYLMEPFTDADFLAEVRSILSARGLSGTGASHSIPIRCVTRTDTVSSPR